MKSATPITEYPTISLPLIVLFNVLVVSWWLEVGLRVEFLATIRFEFLLAGAATACAILRRSSQRRARVVGNPGSNTDIVRWMIIFVVVQLLSLPLAADFDVAWNAVLNRVVKYAILGFLISEYVISPATLRAYLLSSLVAFMKIGQEAFLGKITGSMIWENQGVPRLFGSQGSMFGHPNSLSGKTVSMLPFIWYLYSVVKSRWVRWLILLQVVFALNIIIFTASRTGYLTFIAAALLIIMLSDRGKGRMLLYAAGLALLAIVLVPQEYQERFMSAFTGKESEGHSSDTRKGLFFDSINVFLNHPLGIGAECFPIVQDRADRNAQETHNLYTQILAESGIQGMVCFLGLLTVIIRKALWVRRRLGKLVTLLETQRSRAPPDRAGPIDKEILDNKLLLGTANALVVFTLVRLILGIFGHDLFEIYWWLAAGLTMSLHKMLATAEQRCGELVGTELIPSESAYNKTRKRVRVYP